MASLVIYQVTFLLSTGWSSECLLEWDSFTSLAVPSMLMICIEWWTYEIGSFLIGQQRGGAARTGCDPEWCPQRSQGPRAALHQTPTPSADPLLFPRPAECHRALRPVHHLRSVRCRFHGKGWGLLFQTRAPPGQSQDRHRAKISSSKPLSSPSALKPLPAPAYPSYGDILNQTLNSVPLSAGCSFHCHCDGPITQTHMRASALWLQIPLGLGTAASVQVGNALGAGDAETAKRSSTTSLLCTGQATCVPGSFSQGSFQAQQEQGTFAVLCLRHTPCSLPLAAHGRAGHSALLCFSGGFCIAMGVILAATKDVLGYIFTSDK